MDTSLLDQWDAISGDDYGGVDTYVPPTSSQISGSTLTTSSGVPIGSVVSAGADILGGIGGYLQGQETQQADEYNASLALMQGQFQTEQIGEEETQTLSTQKAIYAKVGVEQSGSVLDTALSTATQYEYSKEIANYNAQSQANMDNYEGEVAAQQGKIALASGFLKAAGSLL